MQAITAGVLAAMLLLVPMRFPTAGEVEDRADAAVAAVLFENDADRLVTYFVQPGGKVSIVFSGNTPDALYLRVMRQLRRHPDVPGVSGERGFIERC